MTKIIPNYCFHPKSLSIERANYSFRPKSLFITPMVPKIETCNTDSP